MPTDRLVWTDMAKGISIVLVVFGHALIGVSFDWQFEEVPYQIALNVPAYFRMPLFFLVTGIFAAISIQRSRAEFVDRTVFHLLYIFVVWNVVQYVARMIGRGVANDPIEPERLLYFLVVPINITWFIWALIASYLIASATRRVPWFVVLPIAAIFSAGPFEVGHYALDRLASLYFFFAAGVYLSPKLMELKWNPRLITVIVLLLAYSVVSTYCMLTGLATDHAIKFVLRIGGIVAVLTLCFWLASMRWAGWLAWLGRNTLPVFVMHTIVTALAREVLLRSGLVEWGPALVVLATAGGILIPLAVDTVLRKMGMPWLFERPRWMRPRVMAA